MLNVNRLRVLVEVARRGSFSAAAEELSYTQSAVSQQIATLESETGMTLLERTSRGVHTTAAGQTLVEHAEGILSRIEAAEVQLSAIAGLRGGRLRMASFPTAGATLMPLAIASFRSRYPEVELTLAEGEPEEVQTRLQTGEFDLTLLFEFTPHPDAVIDEHAPESLDGVHPGERIRRLALLNDPMYLALPLAHHLAARRTLRLEDLAGEAWVQTASASPCARHVVRCCHSAGFEPNVAFESDDYQTVQGLVAAGVGVALIPELALSVLRDDIVIRELSPRPPTRQVIVAVPAGSRITPAASAMVTILMDTASRYEAQHAGRPQRDLIRPER